VMRLLLDSGANIESQTKQVILVGLMFKSLTLYTKRSDIAAVFRQISLPFNGRHYMGMLMGCVSFWIEEHAWRR
jgi:hypothetical protein